MANNKKSFIAYTDWKDTFDALPDDKAGKLIKFIYAYVNDENPTTNDILINAVFANIKNTLKRDLAKWEIHHKQRIEAGKRSAEVRKQNATSVNERSISSTVSVSGSVSVNDNVNVSGSVNENKINKSDCEILINYSFEEFWNAYDKKVGDKTKLEKKWKSFSDDTRTKILFHIVDYKIAQPDKKFRKDPQTYFNNKSWNDEIIKNNNNEQSKRDEVSDIAKRLIHRTLSETEL